MKPARSPRFQSAALCASIAVTSACASVSGAGGAGAAEGAAQAATAQSVRDHTPRTGASVDPGERVTKGVKCRGSAVRRWLEPSERRSRGAMCRRLAAPPSRRLLPLGLPAPLRPGFRPLLGGFLLLRLGPRRLPFLFRRGPRLGRRLRLPHRHRGRRWRRRIHRLHHAGAGPAALRKIGWVEHRMISPPLGCAVGVAYSLRRRSEEHTSELQSRLHLVCRLLLEKKKRRKCKIARMT